MSTPAKHFDPELRANLDALKTAPDFYRVIGGVNGEGAVIVSQLDEPVEFHRSLSGRVANLVPVDDPRDVLPAINAYTQTMGYTQSHSSASCARTWRFTALSGSCRSDTRRPERRAAAGRDRAGEADGPLDRRRDRHNRRMREMEQVATPIADTPEDLTAEWFTSALREGGTIGGDVTVAGARSELIGTGQVGLVVRHRADVRRGRGRSTAVARRQAALASRGRPRYRPRDGPVRVGDAVLQGDRATGADQGSEAPLGRCRHRHRADHARNRRPHGLVRGRRHDRQVDPGAG